LSTTIGLANKEAPHLTLLGQELRLQGLLQILSSSLRPPSLYTDKMKNNVYKLKNTDLRSLEDGSKA
jgi:hypothetical protein